MAWHGAGCMFLKVDVDHLLFYFGAGLRLWMNYYDTLWRTLKRLCVPVLTCTPIHAQSTKLLTCEADIRASWKNQSNKYSLLKHKNRNNLYFASLVLYCRWFHQIPEAAPWHYPLWLFSFSSTCGLFIPWRRIRSNKSSADLFSSWAWSGRSCTWSAHIQSHPLFSTSGW